MNGQHSRFYNNVTNTVDILICIRFASVYPMFKAQVHLVLKIEFPKRETCSTSHLKFMRAANAGVAAGGNREFLEYIHPEILHPSPLGSGKHLLSSRPGERHFYQSKNKSAPRERNAESNRNRVSRPINMHGTRAF